ncbi:hypothetical protein ACFLUZ_00235 [Chloroflexota bacterium]
MAKKKSPKANINLSITIDYSQRMSDWEMWVNKADELIEAAKLLEPHVRESWNIITTDFEEGRYTDPLKSPRKHPPNPQSAYFMLVAFVLENLMKSIVIRSREKEYHNRLFRRLPGDVKTHDLWGLSKKAKLHTTLEEEDLLRRLSRQSSWAGRYPIPIEDAHLKNIETYSDDKSYLTAVFYPNDVNRLSNLLSRVRKLDSYNPNSAEI